MINYETYLYIFDSKFDLKGTKLNIKFENWRNSTLIFISFTMKIISFTMKIKCLPSNSFKKEYKPFLLDSQPSWTTLICYLTLFI